ncbi:ERVV2 protein, partial [Chionis minor]|nr:ERVV2 protein [Chionis minor]
TANMGEVCTLINTTCCTYVSELGNIETDIQKIWEWTKVLHRITQDNTSWRFQELWEKFSSWLPKLGWLKQLFVLLITLIVVSLLFCILLRCFPSCTKGTVDSYAQWKKHQLRQKIESGKYFMQR